MTQLIIGQLINGIIVGSLYGIIALAVSLTSGITGIVNFALGVFMMVGAYVTWFLSESFGLAFPIAAALATVTVAVIGLVADVLLFRHTRNNLINGLIVSIGLISVLVATVLLIWTTTPQNMQPFVSGVFRIGDVIVPKMKLLMCLILTALIVLTYIGLTRTWAGRAAYAYSQNPEAAELMGVPTARLQLGVATFGAALCGVAGAMYATLYSITPEIGSLYMLKGVEAALLAGIGTILGALVGGIMIGVAEGVGSLFLPLAFNDAYGLIMLVLVLLFRPAGLFGGR
ncbi:MAG: branched-chain amino acid ABC transporter permease [Burkholderiaceae bacterium]|nr:branched-chain amino acid ABC transporter permease [Burkholderiaceae bacterium]